MIPSAARLCKTWPSVLSAALRPAQKKGRRVPAEPLICIIDDDASVRRTIVALVRSAGYAARGFASAEEFLGCGTIQAFACIITDVQMPGMSGIELKQHLAASQCLVPVIMITARHDPGLEAQATASGAVSFLRKPLDAGALIRCLEGALEA